MEGNEANQTTGADMTYDNRLDQNSSKVTFNCYDENLKLVRPATQVEYEESRLNENHEITVMIYGLEFVFIVM